MYTKKQSLTSAISQSLQTPSGLKKVATNYTKSLLTSTRKHTLTEASYNSGLHVSQFSRFLSDNKELALNNLNGRVRHRAKHLLKKRRHLTPGSIWRVGILIDATLHNRSSRHIENSQRFNHGNGWVTGHQWTNIALLINNKVVPLPPIAFYTKSYCKKNNLKYRTEHERVLDYLATTNWSEILPGVSNEEIVVLMDSGYDTKKLEEYIQFQGWSFIVSLKSSRGVRTQTQDWQSVSELFRVTRKIGPWQTTQVSSGRKRQPVRVRTLSAFLKEVPLGVEIVCLRKSNGDKLFLACSVKGMSASSIFLAYKLRWKIEIFHKEVKSYLGFEEAGLKKFRSMEAHIYWVYFVYNLLFELFQGEGIMSRLRQVDESLEHERAGKILKLNARFDGKDAVRNHYYQVKQGVRAV